MVNKKFFCHHNSPMMNGAHIILYKKKSVGVKFTNNFFATFPLANIMLIYNFSKKISIRQTLICNKFPHTLSMLQSINIV